MEEYIRTIPPQTQQVIIDYLNESIYPEMIINPQGAAKGRRQLWIQTAPPLTATTPWHVGYEDERIMNFFVLLHPKDLLLRLCLLPKVAILDVIAMRVTAITEECLSILVKLAGTTSVLMTNTFGNPAFLNQSLQDVMI